MPKLYPELRIVEVDQGYKNNIPRVDMNNLMQLERRCFNSNIQEDRKGKAALVAASKICLLVFDTKLNKIVGEAYALDNEWANLSADDQHADHWKLVANKYKNYKVMYLYSIAIHPKYTGKDLAKRLVMHMISCCIELGYDVILSHAKEGASLHIHEFFGANQVMAIPDWYSTGSTYVLCEISLLEFRLKPVMPYYQNTDYTCGPTAIAVILDSYGISETEILQTCRTNRQGTKHEDMIQVFKRLNIPITISSKLNGNLPAIIHTICPGTYEGHYMVICGTNKKFIYTFDVYEGVFGRMSYEELDRAWWSNKYKNQWMLSVCENAR